MMTDGEIEAAMINDSFAMIIAKKQENLTKVWGILEKGKTKGDGVEGSRW
jgi:hypothetical protein